MKLIVGLGNPGLQYAVTRHNVGFQVVDRFAQAHSLTTRRMQFNAVVISGTLGEEKILLARPLTFMNDSGRAVGSLLRWLKLELSELLVITDELDLPIGKLRLRPGGGSAGHNGMISIIQNLGSDQFARLRIGVGRPIHGGDTNFLLSDFGRDEQVVMAEAYDRAVSAVEVFITQGIVTAMNQFNA